MSDEVEIMPKNFVWFCCRCGEVFARTWTMLPNGYWYAISSVCSNHEGDKWNLPGDLSTIHFVGWHDVPLEVLRYQLDRELAFTRSPNHPWNKELENA